MIKIYVPYHEHHTMDNMDSFLNGRWLESYLKSAETHRGHLAMTVNILKEYGWVGRKGAHSSLNVNLLKQDLFMWQDF